MPCDCSSTQGEDSFQCVCVFESASSDDKGDLSRLTQSKDVPHTLECAPVSGDPFLVNSTSGIGSRTTDSIVSLRFSAKEGLMSNDQQARSEAGIGDRMSPCSDSASGEVKISELPGQLYTTLSRAPSLDNGYHAAFAVPRGPIRLHNLGVEEYARIEEWRYYVDHWMVTDSQGMEPPLITPKVSTSPTEYLPSTSINGHSNARARTNMNPLRVIVPICNDILLGSGSDAEGLPSSAHSGVWQDSRRSWDAPKPKFLQRLFQPNTA
ncbi:hypothetical protein FRB91_005933 [Serendipita sp. 411]|nr:hypothetical protein FRB91_005933 [Serendipita sp. 411]